MTTIQATTNPTDRRCASGGGLTVTEAAHLLDESIPADVNCLIEPTLKRYSFDRKWRTTYRVHLWLERDSLPTFDFCEESDDLHQLTQEAIAAYQENAMMLTNHGQSPLPAFLRAAEKSRSHLLADAAARHTPALDGAVDALLDSGDLSTESAPRPAPAQPAPQAPAPDPHEAIADDLAALSDQSAACDLGLDTRRAMDVLAESLGREADPIDRRNREDAEGAAMEGDRWE